MKNVVFITGLIIAFNVNAQVSEMKWGLDYELYLKMSNDSSYKYDIRDAFHVENSEEMFSSEFIFYPVNPGQGYATELSDKHESDTAYATLWSALHDKLGGGWVHFVNCIAYALETQKLSLTNPLMKRPQTDWKPSPMTDSYKRTKNWQYYVPVDQKLAIKEFNLRKKKNELGDLNNLPAGYINLFLNTNQKDYELIIEEKKENKQAKIDLVKVIMGANYLGEVQITYISNAVLSSVKSYSSNKLPSVIIFDEFEAAAAMSLDINGYAVESIIFRQDANLTYDEAEERKQKILEIVEKINQYNSNSFAKRLGSYYNK